jgi:hypothetical protein
MPDEPVLPDEDLVTPEHVLHSISRTPEDDRLAGLSDAELIGEGAQYVARLATVDDNKLFGLVMLLMAAAGAVASMLVARRALQIIRGEMVPVRDESFYG